tara:strand:- start:166 stop:441 length:276 start_codon:yes stop_codon:yes gene_type:complete
MKVKINNAELKLHSEDRFLSESDEKSDRLHIVLSFDNGYQASILRDLGTYGTEIAVMKNNEICYDTPITKDVVGWCNDEDIVEVLDKIRKL